ncbi:hypothetical protein BX666DRAFT_1881512 [Dichotomocladium elegans]|nr:hypothetical protein BX666DRAFT_1881512 [Dichotomocladium elegans]
MLKVNSKESELSTKLYSANCHLSELKDQLSALKHQQSLEQQEPECELEYGQGSNTKVEEDVFVDEVQPAQEERAGVEEENVMAAETEFVGDLAMDLDEEEQAVFLQRLESDKQELQSTLFEYQERSPLLRRWTAKGAELDADDLRNEAVVLLKAKHTAEMEKEALVHDKRILQMHRDLLDHQLIKTMSL